MKLLPDIEHETFDPSRIRLLRIQKKLSQAEFGELIGKSRISIVNWEKGRTCPGATTIDRIAKLFNISKDFFWAK